MFYTDSKSDKFKTTNSRTHGSTLIVIYVKRVRGLPRKEQCCKARAPDSVFLFVVVAVVFVVVVVCLFLFVFCVCFCLVFSSPEPKAHR